jgi:hypothetical protein
MKNTRLFITVAALVSLMLACNISVGDTSTPPTPVVIVVTQVVAADTATPQVAATATETSSAPTDVPTVAPTSTASTPLATPLKDPVNCRFGPSIFYEQVYALGVGAFMPIVGKSADGGWWLVGIPNSNNQTCWVGSSVTTTTGELSGLPTVPAPDAFITNVQLQLKPRSVNLGPGCSVGPFPTFSLKGIISTNGPLEIRWYYETEQDGVSPEKVLKFSSFGPHEVSFSYTPSSWKKGDFWIRIVITKPKGLVSDVTYNIQCK